MLHGNNIRENVDAEARKCPSGFFFFPTYILGMHWINHELASLCIMISNLTVLLLFFLITIFILFIYYYFFHLFLLVGG